MLTDNHATLAQLVERRIRNAQVSSSILLGGSTKLRQNQRFFSQRPPDGGLLFFLSICLASRTKFAYLGALLS